MSYPYVSVEINGRNFAKVVAWHEGGSSGTESVLVLSVPTQELANRLSKAVSHAIELCGGKKSAF